MIVSVTVLGQKTDIPKWAGTWELDVPRSSFGKILFAGAPADFALLSQRTQLEQETDRLKVSAEIVYSDAGGTRKRHEEASFSLDGKETVIGPASLSFRRIDDSTFDILSQLNTTTTNIGEVSHFAVSSDGQTLTETKTQTEREPAPKAPWKDSGAVISTSKFVLVFRKLPDRK
jgi:hypothetical protein